jgi:DNA primase
MDLEELIQSIDIVEYISQFIDLKQKGKEFWGLSCFKEEKTPSFSVKRNPPFFYDYSSGIGGNLFTFVKNYFHCSSQEAVNIIKNYAGVSEAEIVPHNKLPILMDCKRFAKPRGYQKASSGVVLPDNYMDRYEINTTKLQAWENEGISWDSLRRFQVCYDSFSNRLVYPIRNMDGKIVNVGGRTLNPRWKENGERKYTYFFSWGKMETVYGVFENMDYILQKKEVILFEGCKSVLIADTWGIKNTGAILTCHLNSSQLKILAKLGCRVVFALDKDVNVRDDKSIKTLKNYVNCEYLWDRSDLLDSKDSPVDKGKKVFKQLYNERLKLR